MLITIDDTSPTISYFPVSDTLSAPSLSTSWNPYFSVSGFADAPTASGQVGVGTSFHVTSLDGASFTMVWVGTGIQLMGNISQGTYDITLDGMPTFASSSPLSNSTAYITSSSANILASFVELPNANHTIQLTFSADTTATSSSTAGLTSGLPYLAFDKAVLITEPTDTNSSTSTPTSIPDSSVSFFGGWTCQNDTTDNTTYHESTTAGDRAVTSFMGTSFLLTGLTSPQSGNYSVSITITNDTSILNDTLVPRNPVPVPTRYQYRYPHANVPTITQKSTESSSSLIVLPQTTLSALSSFTNPQTQLFFYSGLTTGIAYQVEIVNLSGDLLALQAGGFNIVSPSTTPSSSPSPSTSSSSSSSSAGTLSASSNPSYPKGTIAALALAGILAFLVLLAAIFWVGVWRPRRRRRLWEAEKQRRRDGARSTNSLDGDGDTGAVLDIVPDASGGRAVDMSMRGVDDVSEHDASVKTGIARWREDAEGRTVLKGVGIAFRHSGDADGPGGEKSEVNADADIEDELMSVKSSRSAARIMGVLRNSWKGKGKAQANGNGNKSPSFTLDLPLPRISHSRSRSGSAPQTPSNGGLLPYAFALAAHSNSSASSRRNTNSTTNAHEDVRMHTPSPRQALSPLPGAVRPLPLPPPPIPEHQERRSGHQRDNSRSLLLQYGGDNADDDDEGGYRPGAGLGLVGRSDRGSVLEDVDAGDVVGLRGLSPRTSEAQWETGRASRRPSQAPRPIMREADRQAPGEGPGFLDVRQSSPFRVDFIGAQGAPRTDSGTTAPARLSGLSRVRFSRDISDDGPSSPAGGLDKGKGRETQEKEKKLPSSSPLPPPLLPPQPQPQSTFRLTPLPPIPASITPPERSDDSGVTSFLDFESSTASIRTNSSQRSAVTGLTFNKPPTEKSRWSGGFPNVPPVPSQYQSQASRSRWSSTTTAPSTSMLVAAEEPEGDHGHRATGDSDKSHDSSVAAHSQNSSSNSDPSNNFPFPLSVPPSPHHPRTFQPPRSADQQHPYLNIPSPDDTISPVTSGRHQHPSNITSASATSAASPTDSIPMTVSDIHFRHSESDDASVYFGSRRTSTGSHLPPHPPLPPLSGGLYSGGLFTPQTTREQSLGSGSLPTTPFANSPFIVQRTLGLHTPTIGVFGHVRSLSNPAPPLVGASLGDSRNTPGRSVLDEKNHSGPTLWKDS